MRTRVSRARSVNSTSITSNKGDYFLNLFLVLITATLVIIATVLDSDHIFFTGLFSFFLGSEVIRSGKVRAGTMFLKEDCGEFFGDFRMLSGDVLFLGRVFGKVVEFERIFEPAAIAFPVFNSHILLESTFVDLEVEEGVFCFLWHTEEGRKDGDAVCFDGDFGAGEVGGGGHEVDVGGEEIAASSGGDLTRPVSDEGRADSAFVE